MEFPVENGAASPHYIVLVQLLVIIQMQFVLAVVISTVEVHFWMKLSGLTRITCLILYYVCNAFLSASCFCLIFHLRIKKTSWFDWALPLLPCPLMDFPSRYPQVIIWSQSAGLDSAQYVHTLWSLPPSLRPSLLQALPLLLSLLEYLLLSDLMKEFN